MKLNNFAIHSSLALVLFLSPLLSQGSSVAQVKETKVLINLEGSSFSSGDEIYLVNESGKKVGLAKIKAIKGDKALAELIKGKANPGMSVQVKVSATGNVDSADQPSIQSHEQANEETSKKTSSSSSKKKKNVGGFLAGYALNTMALTAQYSINKSDINMKDSGYLLKGFYDYTLMKDLVIRFAGGLQTFNAKDTASKNVCDNGNTAACEVSFTYLLGEANGNYYLTDGSFKFWLGLGYSFLITATKKNNVSNLSSDSSTNQMITAGLGADWWISKQAFIPVSFQYGMFPGSSNVKAESLIIQAGYGFYF